MPSRVRESEEDIYREIDRKIKRDAQMRRDARNAAEEIRDHGRDHEAPVRTGRYAASVHVEDRPDYRGYTQFWIGTRVFYAGWVEFGTEDTPEYAPAARTAFRFGGTAP